MRRAALVLAALALAAGLTGCGPSEREQAGGELVLDHYYPMTTVVMSGKVAIPTTTMVPICECEMPR